MSSTMRFEEALENAYWEFDKKRKEHPEDERISFKWAVKDLVIKHFFKINDPYDEKGVKG
jgi:hypothetical protein